MAAEQGKAGLRLAACVVVRNEGRDLAEWLAFHALAGFDATLVYDHASTDDTACVVAAASRLQDVRVVRWEHTSGRAQMDAYLHAMRENAGEFDWIAALDADEFLVVHLPGGVRALCRAAPADADAIAVCWAMFGANGHEQFPDVMVTEAFTRRSEAGFAPNRHVKSLVRPGAAQACPTPHTFIVPGRTVRPDGSDIAWAADPDGHDCYGLMRQPADHGIAQVNHYFTRSRAHWAARLSRGNFIATRTWAEFDVYDRNEIEDRSALVNGAAVRQRRDAIMALARL